MKQIPIMASKKDTVKPQVGGYSLRVLYVLVLARAERVTRLTYM